MAWEELEFGRLRGVTGDAPFDELGKAFDNIRRCFLKHFGRPPYFSELLRVMLAAVAIDPLAYVADATLPSVGQQLEPRRGSDMAWEGLESDAVRAVTGEEPFVEMRSAVKRIRREYLERYGRNPYFAELVYPSLITVEAESPGYVADTTSPSLKELADWACVGTMDEHIDPGPYEAGIDEESHDFMIFLHDLPSNKQRESVVVRGQETKIDEHNLICRYTILTPAITDGMARSLIRMCVLHDLLKYDIIDGNLTIQFERTT